MNKINCLNLPVLKRQVSKYTKPHHIHASESLGGVKISSRKIKVPTEFTENGVHIAMFDEPQVTVTFENGLGMTKPSHAFLIRQYEE